MANPAQCGHNSCFRRIAAMLRRVFAIIAVLSAMGFVAFVGLGIRQHFAIDQFHIYRWNPSTRRYTQIFIGWDRDNFGVHTESTTALASDDTSVIRSKAGPSNLKIVHDVFPLGPPPYYSPWLWGDHFHSTPSMGINQMGLSDCWSLLFRLEVALGVFGVLPGIWMGLWVRRWSRRRALGARGFAVVGGSGSGAVD